METLPPPRALSDYRQQFIPKKVLKTFATDKVEFYKDFEDKPSIEWDAYNEYEKIVAYIYELKRKYPHLVKVINIGTTAEKRPLLVIKISPVEGRTYDRIFIEGGIHANEWISPNAVLVFINRLVTEWKTLPHYMTAKTWLILPLANPDGYVYSHINKDNRMWRKNRQNYGDSNCVGVDLNRNFSIGWDKNQINTDPCSSNYKGVGPFSEKETKAIRNFLLPQKPYLKSYVAFHSFGQEIRYSWAYSTPIEGKERILEVIKEAIAKVNSTTGSKKCRYKQLEKSIQNLYGVGRDWARKELNVQYSFTVELRDKGKKGFNLKPTFILRTGADVFSFMQVIAKAIYDDYNNLKRKLFIKQEYCNFLQQQTHLYKRPKSL